jgi:hypothetical protein
MMTPMETKTREILVEALNKVIQLQVETGLPNMEVRAAQMGLESLIHAFDKAMGFQDMTMKEIAQTVMPLLKRLAKK